MYSSRRQHRRLRVIAATGILVVAIAAAPATGAATSTSQTPPSPVDPTPFAVNEPTTVTLITGDRVTVSPSPDGGEPDVIVNPARGSSSSGFSIHQDGDAVQVIPTEIADLVPEVLDPALFDVTGLIEMEYDDANGDAMPLIVEQKAGPRTLDADSPLKHDKNLRAINAAAVHLQKSAAAEFGDDLAAVDEPAAEDAAAALDGVTKVWLDRRVEAAELDAYLGQVNAPEAWDSGLDGAGVTLAVLDTGVDAGHPALAGRISAERDFTGTGSPVDDHGHGTHVTSIAAGNGAGSDGARQGIAPAAKVLSGKVLNAEGRGLSSWVIAGMEWAAAQGADIINMSLGADPTKTDDPLVLTLERLTAETGALFAVAAGNRGWLGWAPLNIETPGSAPSALTVGAVRGDDIRALFSSQGPTRGSYRLKPDVAAPGVGIMGARAGARETDLYFPDSGTSMATPIVAGAAALLVQEHPDWSWDQVKTHIVTTADAHESHMAWSVGGGRLDLEQATTQQLRSNLAALDFGYTKHPDESPKTRTVTLTNDGSEPVSVTITDEVGSETGEVAPDDVLVAEPDSLTVPAGGTASTTVTFTPELVEDGYWDGGMSFNSGGETLLRLPFGTYDEPERYDLELRLLDRNGEPYDPATGADHPNGETTVTAFNADTGASYQLQPDETGYVKQRVAPGSYSLFARIVTPAGDGEPETMAITGTPELIVDEDTSYVMDARDAERLDAPTIAGQQTSIEQAVGVAWSRHTDSRRGFTGIGFFDPDEVADGQLYVTPTSTVEHGTFEASFRWRLAPSGKINPTSPDLYELLLATPQFPDPLSPSLSRRDVEAMAEINSTFHPVGEPGEYPYGLVYKADDTNIGFIYRSPVEAPGQQRVLLTAEPHVEWAQCINPPANDYAEMCDDLRNLTPRESIDTQFGAGLRPEIWESRHSSGLFVARAGFGDGVHGVYLSPTAAESSALTLHRNGELIDSVDGTSGFFTIPDGPAQFRLEQEWTLSDSFSRSKSAHTVWEFESAPPTDPSQGSSTYPPLMAINYQADVDELGQVDARKPLHLDIDLSHKVGSERVESLRVWWSIDDGESWQGSQVKRTGQTSFRGIVPGNILRSGDTVSLRVSATDAAGDSIDQTVMGIFPVR